jgi:hypothetical protein
MSQDVGRRALLKAAGAAAILPSIATAATGPAPSRQSSETLTASLWKTLRPEQKKVVAFPFDHPLRAKVDNNWEITEPIAEVFDKDQQAMLRDIFRGLHNPDYADRVWAAMVHDQEGDGFEKGCSAALFGTPGSGKFELVITGRHVTRRCDGDSVAGISRATAPPSPPTTRATLTGIRPCGPTRSGRRSMASSGPRRCWPSRAARVVPTPSS